MSRKFEIGSWRISATTIFLFIIFHFPFVISNAQPKDISSSEILHRIEGLKTVATVLYIAAHPDDENTRLISYLEKDKHYRVAYLSLTRGEGGQNLIGNEQGMDLGILRTQELLAARRIDGGEQFFSTAYDFGYSKTPDETLKKWNREKIRNDIIMVMNHLQPDIVICRFPTTGEGGHGHHTASAILAEEAFDTLVKQNGNYIPKKLFWNTFNFGSRNTTSEDQLKIDVGGFNALLGKSYGEIAAEARSMHRCQAFGSERRRGEQFEYFKSLRDNTPKLGNTGATDRGLMEGIVTDWSRFKGGDVINKKIDEIIKKFDVKDPSKSIKALVELKRLIEKNTVNEPQNSIVIKISEINQLILDCAGVYVEVTSRFPVYFASDSIHLKLNAINRSGIKIAVNFIVDYELGNLNFKNGSAFLLEPNKVVADQISLSLEDKATNQYPTNPYLVYESMLGFPENKSRWVYYHKDQFSVYFPEFRTESELMIEYEIEGEKIVNFARLNYKFIDPSYGEKFQPVFLFADSSMNSAFHLAKLNYDHIPTQIYYTKPDPELKFDYLKHNKGKIGYIVGAGDKIPEILSEIGYDVTLLDENNISTFELSNFQTIVTGVRAYNTQKWLSDYNDKFFKYVEQGGNLIVQYNTSNGLVVQPPQFYNYDITRDRVTEEESKVTIKDTTLEILNFPNKIREKDFEGWVQEYGLYFPNPKDFNFIQPFSMNDTGENPNLNSLIYCLFGKGKFVYTGLSFFRELPAGVEGATKLFVNLIENNTNTFVAPTVNGELKGDSNYNRQKKLKKDK